VVRIFQDDDAVTEVQVETLLAVGVGIVLRDPEAGAFVPAKSDGLTDIWLGGEERGLKARRKVQLGERLGQRQQRNGLGLIVRRLRKRRGEGGGTEDEG
jgi:hypothetical protein